MPGARTNGLLSSRGPTRLQLSLYHAAADAEGGSPSVGQWIRLRDGELGGGDVGGLGDDDWLLIDCSALHSPMPTPASLAHLTATSRASPIIRVPVTEPKRIRWAQDSGAHGVLVTRCETKEQAEQIVVATGCPSPRFVVMAEIGSRKAVGNVDRIAGVAGIDALFVGPGKTGDGGSAYDDDDDDAVLAAARKHAKFAGHFAADAEAAAALVGRGWLFVSCGMAEAAAAAGEEVERLRGMVRRMRTTPPPVEGEEYEWDGKDWG